MNEDDGSRIRTMGRSTYPMSYAETFGADAVNIYHKVLVHQSGEVWQVYMTQADLAASTWDAAFKAEALI